MTNARKSSSTVAVRCVWIRLECVVSVVTVGALVTWQLWVDVAPHHRGLAEYLVGVVVVGSLVATVRLARAGVFVSTNGVTVRRLLRTRRVFPGDIRAVKWHQVGRSPTWQIVLEMRSGHVVQCPFTNQGHGTGRSVSSAAVNPVGFLLLPNSRATHRAFVEIREALANLGLEDAKGAAPRLP